MNSPYFLLFKTAQAEFRAWKHTAADSRGKLSLLVELTRGRKNRGVGQRADGSELSKDELRISPGLFGFSKNVDWVKLNLSSQPMYIIDITRERSLECKEVLDLKSPVNGYQCWVSFLDSLLDEGHTVAPVLQVSVLDNDTEDSYIGNLRLQFSELSRRSSTVYYRASVIDDGDFFLDIISLRDDLSKFISNGGEFSVILDHGFIRSGTASLHAVRTANFIANLRSIVPGCRIVIISTSFPRDVEELGDPESGSFRTEETFLFEEVVRLTNDPVGIFYGDYGSINPERFDGVARGWRPRIDYPTNSRRIIYEREKRNGQGTAYSSHYESVARKIVSKDEFRRDGLSCWGRDMIMSAASSSVPGSAPSFWTSVRMQIYIEQQLKRLGLSS